MSNEIKEILDYFRKYATIRENTMISEVEDYITNLQEEVEDLRESNWAWHQTLKAQNKREYRSKFLKEFQQEYNTNTFPDYDEIYKRYDKLQEENKKLKKENEIERLNNIIEKLEKYLDEQMSKNVYEDEYMTCFNDKGTAYFNCFDKLKELNGGK